MATNQTHTIEILSPYNPVAKVVWVLVDGERRMPLVAATADDVDAAIAALYARLEEEDRQREEERTCPKRYSKLRLYAALAQAGLWDALVAWLEAQTVDGVNAWVAFQLAQDLTSDNELFSTWLSAAQSALGVDDATVAAILAAAEISEG